MTHDIHMQKEYKFTTIFTGGNAKKISPNKITYIFSLLRELKCTLNFFLAKTSRRATHAPANLCLHPRVAF